MTAEPVRHHYLAESYLNRFCNPEGFLCVYDRKENKFLSLPPNETTVIRKYYTFRESENKSHVEIEKLLSEMEGDAKSTIDQIDLEQPITEAIRGIVAAFVAFQWTRVPAFQKWSDNLAEQMDKQLLEFTFYNEEMAEKALKVIERETGEKIPITPEQMSKFAREGNYRIQHTREHSLKAMMAMVADTIPIFQKLNTIILVAPPQTSFITCDNPFNLVPPPWHIPNNFWGVGILTKGSSKIVPLSPKSCLLLGDPGDLAFYRKDLSREDIRKINIGIAGNSERFIIGRDKIQMERIIKTINHLGG